MRKLSAIAVITLVLPTAASACVEGAKCLKPPEGKTTFTYQVGDILPRGQYQVLLNSQYYGLPPSRDGSWYYKVDRRVMRVRPDTLEVLEDVTDETNRAF